MSQTWLDPGFQLCLQDTRFGPALPRPGFTPEQGRRAPGFSDTSPTPPLQRELFPNSPRRNPGAGSQRPHSHHGTTPNQPPGRCCRKHPADSSLTEGSTQAGAGGCGRPARPGSGFWPPGPGTILDPPPVPLRICEKGAQRPPPPTISVVFLMHVTLGTPGARPSRTDDGVSTGERMRGHRVTSGDIFLMGTSRRPSAETLRRHPPQDSAIDASGPPIWSPVPPHCP